jgi:hypothetical protein
LADDDLPLQKLWVRLGFPVLNLKFNQILQTLKNCKIWLFCAAINENAVAFFTVFWYNSLRVYF